MAFLIEIFETLLHCTPLGIKSDKNWFLFFVDRSVKNSTCIVRLFFFILSRTIAIFGKKNNSAPIFLTIKVFCRKSYCCKLTEYRIYECNISVATLQRDNGHNCIINSISGKYKSNIHGINKLVGDRQARCNSVVYHELVHSSLRGLD
ncbi:hypothetical protein PUN28_004751 [Cardiocondyla obscurior]|uniref:Uncharacterized protein n=1 Tax=Cardiocondyla obscurior TaxID=286306 RepID=A0AAW2GCZ3_9HYME